MHFTTRVPSSVLMILCCSFIIHVLLLCWTASPIGASSQTSLNDCPTFRSKPFNPKFPYEFDGTVESSTYITMRDQVKIACDLYIPFRALNENHRLPTLFHVTRYGRSHRIRWPFSYIFGERVSSRGIPFKTYTGRGYAVVSCDTRGTGASYGKRLYDFHHEEVEDYRELLNWIIQQKFSDGKVVSVGISYDGMATDFMMSLNHPALVAVATISSPFDMYRDVLYPGGLYQYAFLDAYLKSTKNLESGGLPDRYKACKGCEPVTLKEKFFVWLGKFMIDGVEKVNFDFESYHRALEEHKGSTNTLDLMPLFEEGIDKEVTTSTFSYSLERDGNFRVINATKRQIPMIMFGGYYDGTIQNSVVKRFYSMKNRKNKLILGSYTHGFRKCASPYLSGNSPCFNAMIEAMRFFDHYVGKDTETGIDTEPRVHFHTVGSEKWHSANEWPPKEVSETIFNLDGNGKLIGGGISSDSSLNFSHKLKLNLTEQVVIHSKFNIMSHLYEKYPQYTEKLSDPNWKNGKLNYISEPLSNSIEITGYPKIDIELSGDNKDGVIFAYLMEVENSSGLTRLIMDTQLRLVHRKLRSSLNNGLVDVIPIHSFYITDREYLQPNEKTKVSLYFPTISYHVQKGNSLALSLFSFDSLNFKLFNGTDDLSKEIIVYSGSLTLPTIVRDGNGVPSNSRKKSTKDEF
ncbi:hypothetical protein C9374_001011 [Naegleria lovaniensis]|uniref:Xaa-Pro dipeptidyl-peptidase C-terminal domain-containing protein n=1 Tax=Naegleria lovaniensis TaxID=51637 RepID=A0AA88GY74_NAELO|nr:uncharacterized protein C9374_001011 [Naegleria lovaniensis]KAG2388161.1 hypothetical protein C9374_001011 [Naegleria lovaniensis]